MGGCVRRAARCQSSRWQRHQSQPRWSHLIMCQPSLCVRCIQHHGPAPSAQPGHQRTFCTRRGAGRACRQQLLHDHPLPPVAPPAADTDFRHCELHDISDDDLGSTPGLAAHCAWGFSPVLGNSGPLCVQAALPLPAHRPNFSGNAGPRAAPLPPRAAWAPREAAAGNAPAALCRWLQAIRI